MLFNRVAIGVVMKLQYRVINVSPLLLHFRPLQVASGEVSLLAERVP